MSEYTYIHIIFVKTLSTQILIRIIIFHRSYSGLGENTLILDVIVLFSECTPIKMNVCV